MHRHKSVPHVYLEDLRKLEDEFAVSEIRLGPNNEILDFAVKYKSGNPEWLEVDNGFEISFREDGYYFINISYSANDEMFEYFRKLTRDISEKLGFKIKDPQIGEELHSPKEYEDQFVLSEERAQFAKKAMEKIVNDPLLPYWIPTTSKYFTKIFLLSKEPKTQNTVILLMDGDQLYCNKVEKGEVLNHVLEKDVFFLTGSKEFKVVSVKDGGSAKDRHGNDLPRKDIIIAIPYFDPATRLLKRRMAWSPF